MLREDQIKKLVVELFNQAWISLKQRNLTLPVVFVILMSCAIISDKTKTFFAKHLIGATFLFRFEAKSALLPFSAAIRSEEEV